MRIGFILNPSIDKLLPIIEWKFLFLDLVEFPTSVHVFDDPPIFCFSAGLSLRGSLANNGLRSLWAARMAFRNFIYTKYDDEVAFLPKEPSLWFNPAYQVTLLTLESKVDSLEAKKARLEAIEVSFCREVEELKQDKRDVAAFEGPFDLSKAKGYRSSYKKEHTQASNDFATVTFPWLDEFVANSAAPIEALLSKKPPTLQEPAPSWTQMHVPSSSAKLLRPYAPSLNPMSTSCNLVMTFHLRLTMRRCHVGVFLAPRVVCYLLERSLLYSRLWPLRLFNFAMVNAWTLF
ncbi:hypothetical protein Tco_1420217 [Tanacetum coccineum]